MSYLSRIITGTAFGLALALGFGGCNSGRTGEQIGNTNENGKLPVGEYLLKSGLNDPKGLSVSTISSNSFSTKSKTLDYVSSIGDMINGAYITAPAYDSIYCDSFNSPPSLNRFEGTLEEIVSGDPIPNSSIFPMNPSASLSTEDFCTEVGSFNPVTNKINQRGLYLDAVILGEDYLVSSNVSNKIWKVDKFGAESLWLQNEELSGITDMTLGKDGKIYAAQSQIYSENSGEYAIARNKRLVSIDSVTKDIISVAEFPTQEKDGISIKIGATNNYLPFSEQLKIADDSGKDKAFVADFSGDAVYEVTLSTGGVVKVNSGKNIYPSAIANKADGRMMISQSPLLDEITNSVASPSKIISIDPKVVDDVPLDFHPFSGTFDEYESGYYKLVAIDGTDFHLPELFSSSMSFLETSTQDVVFSTDNVQGNLKIVVKDK